jgi:hypothetical protein
LRNGLTADGLERLCWGVMRQSANPHHQPRPGQGNQAEAPKGCRSVEVGASRRTSESLSGVTFWFFLFGCPGWGCCGPCSILQCLSHSESRLD